MLLDDLGALNLYLVLISQSNYTSFFLTLLCSRCPQQPTYAFWRPHAPPGFAILGDYMTTMFVNLLRFWVFHITVVYCSFLLSSFAPLLQSQATIKRSSCCKYSLCKDQEARGLQTSLAPLLILKVLATLSLSLKMGKRAVPFGFRLHQKDTLPWDVWFLLERHNLHSPLPSAYMLLCYPHVR